MKKNKVRIAALEEQNTELLKALELARIIEAESVDPILATSDFRLQIDKEWRSKVDYQKAQVEELASALKEMAKRERNYTELLEALEFYAVVDGTIGEQARKTLAEYENKLHLQPGDPTEQDIGNLEPFSQADMDKLLARSMQDE